MRLLEILRPLSVSADDRNGSTVMYTGLFASYMRAKPESLDFRQVMGAWHVLSPLRLPSI